MSLECADFDQPLFQEMLNYKTSSPHRLVVRTSRRGRDNPGSTPGEDIFILSDSLLSFTLLEFVARRTAAGKLHAGAIQDRITPQNLVLPTDF